MSSSIAQQLMILDNWIINCRLDRQTAFQSGDSPDLLDREYVELSLAMHSIPIVSIIFILEKYFIFFVFMKTRKKYRFNYIAIIPALQSMAELPKTKLDYTLEVRTHYFRILYLM